ncbi:MULTISPECIES: alanine racemase [Nocardiopsis]|uniref:Alanine racemase n=1 Tax=Nocardiopsis sinuspersici TaxID=501010 RepID=A0A1V3C4K7_9ACTN|nr:MULTISPECIES: alanine racemase [Nocardiopsis]NYH52009.1 alanine racemase [Nocardiopsis sinuspersici]OOC55568.1 alanine racemase [Nocardiopsis sinuspersici]
MSHFAHARVDLDAIAHNARLLRECAGGTPLMGVVKADGYGHGMLPAARALIAGGATWLGTAFIDEALELRRAGLTLPVLAWIIPPGEPVAEAVEADVDLGVSDRAVLDTVIAEAVRLGRTARVQLKADTGLNRGGVNPADWRNLVDAAARAEDEGHLRVCGVWSHFACADEPGHPSIALQLSRFHEALEIADKAGLDPEVRHIANSAALLTLPEARFDLVRGGIAGYGLCPIPDFGATGLRPAMTLRSRIALTKRVPAGSGVSYGHRYVTDRETTLALVPLGYADGVPRAATNKGPVLLGGRSRVISGTVCMDQFVVDVGDDTVEAGEYAVLFGDPGEDPGVPTAEDWARILDTIPYEIVTRVGVRVPREYVGAPA